MSANSSSSLLSIDQHCFDTRPTSFIFIAYNVATIIFLVPLIILVLVVAWQQKRPHTCSHLDCFTYHTTVIETLHVVKLVPYVFGANTDNMAAVQVGGLLSSFVWYGETSFHVLTCADQYLAVVHPLTYRSLRSQRGARIRNVCVGLVWLLCSLRVGLGVTGNTVYILDFCLVVVSLLVTLFCNLSALGVLVRPGPGEPARERPDRSKQKAFHTMVVILGVLVLRFASSLVWGGIFVSQRKNECLIMAGVIWCNLPSSLVLPLLFLHKRRKFASCRDNK